MGLINTFIWNEMIRKLREKAEAGEADAEEYSVFNQLGLITRD